MGTMTASSFPISSGASNYDEVSMQQSLLFSDCLKDLKNLRAQLYSAAEWTKANVVVETLRNFAIKALINTVDHLRSVTFKVDDLLDEKVDEVSRTEFQVSCIERAINGSNGTNLKYGCSLDDEDDWRRFKNAIRATIRDSPPASNSVQGNGAQSPSPFPQPPPHRSGTFHFTSITSRKELGATTPNPIGHAPPNFIFPGGLFPLEPRKSPSMQLHVGREKGKEATEQQPRKSKPLLKALLSRRKSKDDMLYTYLDEY